MSLMNYLQNESRNQELRKIRQLQEQKGNDRRCPKCGRSIPMDARYCPYSCNLKEEKKEDRYCSKCGEAIAFDARFCAYCGVALP